MRLGFPKRFLFSEVKMSKLSKAVAEMQKENVLRLDETIKNFMGGDSYKLNPVDTLKLIASSSIFGEPSYYRPKVKDDKFTYDSSFMDDFSTYIKSLYDLKSTTEVFTEAVDTALDFDFGETLALAIVLRKVYNMRLNPQVIMVRAAIHPKRAEWCSANPGKFAEVESIVMARADEPMTQLAYYMYINNGKKNKIPTILKKSIANKLSGLKPYQVNKYKNAEIGMINAVRITHANSDVLNELMKTGSVSVDEDEVTWEQLKSAGKSWVEILDQIDLGHMALLRNLNGIFTEINNPDFCDAVLKQLKDGVLTGKQLPFRYYNAYNVIFKSSVNHKSKILEALEECIDISIANLPHLKGKTMCLSDNSGSAWGQCTSEYGVNTVAEIDNLSAVIAAMASDEGEVGKFGDKLIKTPIVKRSGALNQANRITEQKYHDVGGNTEGGIWEFFKEAIDNKLVYDNIFIFSDQQAGHGGLYGTSEHLAQYMERGYNLKVYINVFKLVQDYRKTVNPKVNVFSVQTGGYDNGLVPQMSYRTAMLSGWTGKEVEFAKAYIDTWDEIEKKKASGDKV